MIKGIGIAKDSGEAFVLWTKAKDVSQALILLEHFLYIAAQAATVSETHYENDSFVHAVKSLEYSS